MDLPPLPVIPLEMVLSSVDEETRRVSKLKYKQQEDVYNFWKEKNPSQPLSSPLQLLPFPMACDGEEKIIFQLPTLQNPILVKKLLFTSKLAKELEISPYILAGNCAIKLKDIDIVKFPVALCQQSKQYRSGKEFSLPLDDVAEIDFPLEEIVPQISSEITIEFEFQQWSLLGQSEGRWGKIIEKLWWHLPNEEIEIVVSYFLPKFSNFDVTVYLI